MDYSIKDFPTKAKNKLLRLLKYCGIYRPDIKNISLPEIVTIIIQCIADVCEYLNITPDEFLRRNQQWPSLEEFLWNESDGDLSLFYRSWNGKYAEYNICCNSYNQLLYPENFGVLAHIGGIVVRGGGGGGIYVDYGCGTASLSFGLFLSGYIKGRLILLDVRNDTNDFIHWRIKKYGLEDAVEFHDADAFNAMGICDGLFCIDVLEHLSNSSEIFIKRIDPLIKCGGFAILRAPWGGQLTHIDAARDNFYTAGGKEFLMRNYKEYYRFDANDIGAVYRKKGML